MAYKNMKTNKAHIRKIHIGFWEKRNLKRKNKKLRAEIQAQQPEPKPNYGLWHNILVLIKYIIKQWQNRKKNLQLGL